MCAYNTGNGVAESRTLQTLQNLALTGFSKRYKLQKLSKRLQEIEYSQFDLGFGERNG
jgi:hypothetical protein